MGFRGPGEVQRLSTCSAVIHGAAIPLQPMDNNTATRPRLLIARFHPIDIHEVRIRQFETLATISNP